MSWYQMCLNSLHIFHIYNFHALVSLCQLVCAGSLYIELTTVFLTFLPLLKQKQGLEDDK